jgi:hypothetical protein
MYFVQTLLHNDIVVFRTDDADIVTKAQKRLCDLNDENEVNDSDIYLDYVKTFSSSESDIADLDNSEDSQFLSNVWDNISLLSITRN